MKGSILKMTNKGKGAIRSHVGRYCHISLLYTVHEKTLLFLHIYIWLLRQAFLEFIIRFVKVQRSLMKGLTILTMEGLTFLVLLKKLLPLTTSTCLLNLPEKLFLEIEISVC